jgi:predicted dinucleotide-binding enzyme
VWPVKSLDVFIAGDDADAKATVAKLAGDGGLNPIGAAPLNEPAQDEHDGIRHAAARGGPDEQRDRRQQRDDEIRSPCR